jgi:hypothetical protein
MRKTDIAKPISKAVGVSLGKAGKVVVQNINPLELVREYFTYRRIADEQKTERNKIQARREAVITAIETEKDIILKYFEYRFSERADALNSFFKVLHKSFEEKNDIAMDKALEGILGIIKDNPLKDFESFRKARLENKTIEI